MRLLSVQFSDVLLRRDRLGRAVLLAGLAIILAAVGAAAQGAPPKAEPPRAAAEEANSGRQYSGMYSFLKDGEFVQITVEDKGQVTGFVSRYGDGESDKGAFLDQFFKSGQIDGSKLMFTTDTVHGVSFEFSGVVQRGEGKSAGEEAFYVLKGTLKENSTDANKKATSQSREVIFKMFPQQAAEPPSARN